MARIEIYRLVQKKLTIILKKQPLIKLLRIFDPKSLTLIGLMVLLSFNAGLLIKNLTDDPEKFTPCQIWLL